MRFVAKLRVKDRRPEKPDDEKKAEKNKPEGGWRNKSGITKISPDAVINADNVAAATKTLSSIVSKLPEKTAKDVVDVTLERDDPVESTDTPWGISEDSDD